MRLNKQKSWRVFVLVVTLACSAFFFSSNTQLTYAQIGGGGGEDTEGSCADGGYYCNSTTCPGNFGCAKQANGDCTCAGGTCSGGACSAS